MKLLTKEIERKLPALYSQEEVKDPIVWVKFFNPVGAGTWFAIEYDPEERLFFGWAEITPGCGELGYFSLDELSEFRGFMGLGIERDLYWHERPLSEAIKGR